MIEGSIDPMAGLRPHASGYVDCAQPGVRLYYEVYGDPSAPNSLLIINGGLAKIPCLGHVLRAWARHPFRVLVYESRGLSRSACPAGLQTTRLLAGDALAVAEVALGQGCRFHLVGASLGGMVAQELMYELVARGEASRVLGAYLMVTSGGSWLRPPPFLRYPLIRHTLIAGVMYADQADYERKFPRVAAMLFSREWLDAPPPAGSCEAGGSGCCIAAEVAAVRAAKKAAATGQQQQQQKPQQQQGHEEQQEEGDGEALPSRRELVSAIFARHWRDMLAGDLRTEAEAAAWQATALVSHYLQPARAAAIRRSGIPICVGISSRDAIMPERRQRALAEALGARRAEVLWAGHMDGCVLDGADPRVVLEAWGMDVAAPAGC